MMTSTRLPYTLSFVLFLGLVSSSTYWYMHLNQPRPRPVAAPPAPAPAPVNLEAAASLFGGAARGPATRVFELVGTLVAGAGSSAIIGEGSTPAKAVRLGGKVAEGVLLEEVHARHVVVRLENGVQRVDLKPGASLSVTPVETAAPAVVPTRTTAASTAPAQRYECVTDLPGCGAMHPEMQHRTMRSMKLHGARRHSSPSANLATSAPTSFPTRSR